MVKLLFVIHDLGQGGAEKVLVNLVNSMDPAKFDITVTALFGGGVNEGLLAPHIRYRAVFPWAVPGNSRLMKLLTPKQLHRICIRERYDVEVSYLEGPSARVVSGCENGNTKLVGWIHVQQGSMKKLAASFRSEKEARSCYGRFHQTVCVSRDVLDDFTGILDFKRPCRVLCNTVAPDRLLRECAEAAPGLADDGKTRLVAVGTLKPSKGYERLLRIMKRLHGAQRAVHLYILGAGPLERKLKAYVRANGLADSVTFLGFQPDPGRYVAKCDLFVCASLAEGFSTAAAEALILGTPVCTVEVSGMGEMLGGGEFGVITANDEDALYRGISRLLDDPALLAHYRKQALWRGRQFSAGETVKAVEEMLLNL